MTPIPAIYENGVFKPTAPVNLAPGARARITLDEMLEDPVTVMKARFPNSFGGMSEEDAEEMLRNIEEDCGRIDFDDWK